MITRASPPKTPPATGPASLRGVGDGDGDGDVVRVGGVGAGVEWEFEDDTEYKFVDVAEDVTEVEDAETPWIVVATRLSKLANNLSQFT